MTKDKQTLAHYMQNPVVQKVNDAKYVLEKNMNEINTNMDKHYQISTDYKKFI